LTISHAIPRFYINETGVSANNKLWDISADGEQLRFGALNDANDARGLFMTVDRTGTTIDTVTMPGSSFVVSGTMAALDMAGQIDLNTNNIIAGGTAAFTTITASIGVIQGSTNSAIILSGGSTNILGANIVMYGESHASQAADWELRSGTTVRVDWDESNLKFRVNFNFQVDGDIGFYTTAPQAIGNITGDTEGNLALQNLLTDLNRKGLIADATT
ncbi:hypothetical protein LCGC14_2971240, partial [marine sediment metagenome]